MLSVDNQRIVEDKLQKLHIAIAPTKNMDRIEWFLEKATEMGITEITFLLCQNSERDKIRLDRLEKIVESAMKQSLQATLPKLNELIKFDTFIKQNFSFDEKNKGYIAYCNDEQLPFYPIEKNENHLVLIGPEGDFSQKEVENAKKANFQGISLGQNRLRTETAGILVASCFYTGSI